MARQLYQQAMKVQSREKVSLRDNHHSASFWRDRRHQMMDQPAVARQLYRRATRFEHHKVVSLRDFHLTR